MYTTSRFQVGDNFETSAPNDIDTAMSKVHKVLLNLSEIFSKIAYAPNGLRMTLDSQRTLIHEILTPTPKALSVLFHEQLVSRYQVVECRKCIEWPEGDLEHLADKSNLCTVLELPHEANCCLFCSTKHYRDTRLTKITNTPYDHRISRY